MHIDLNGNGFVEFKEPLFALARRGDDDIFSFSAMNRPEYGVLYESQNKSSYHEAANFGPSACCLGDPVKEGSDFETNDRPPANSQSNAFLYNNRNANQHGEGRSKYYLEQINPGSAAAPLNPFVYDEVEGYFYHLNFEHHLDDPTTSFDETGACNGDYFRTTEAVTRGYLIPVADLPGLQDGELSTLFGWEDVDLAAYLRLVIAPKLSSPDLNIFNPLGEPGGVLPPTHILLLQTRAPIVINTGDTCGVGEEQAQNMANYWGIPPTGAVFRSSSILGFHAGFTAGHHGAAARPWVDAPLDGAALNLWLLDHFFRDGTSLGKYEVQGSPWTIQAGAVGAVIDMTTDKVLVTDTTVGPSSLRAPLPRSLERTITLVDVAESTNEPVGMHQLILQGGGAVVAYVELTNTSISINLGGSLDSDGFASGGETSTTGSGVTLGDLSLSEYTRLVLEVADDQVNLYSYPAGSYTVNDFNLLTQAPHLVLSLEEGPLLAVDAVRLSTSGAEIFGLSTIAVFENLSVSLPLPRFVRGDADGDGTINISDAIKILFYAFLGAEKPPCLDAADSADEGEINITSATQILSWLFTSGPAPPPPTPSTPAYPLGDCGPDPTADTVPGGDLGCLSFPPCPP